MRDAVLFTYDDHQAGRRSRTCPASRTGSAACATGAGSTRSISIRPARAAPEYELYDLENDPDEALNLVDKRTGRGRTAAAERERRRLHERLEEACAATGTLTPALPQAKGPSRHVGLA